LFEHDQRRLFVANGPKHFISGARLDHWNLIGVGCIENDVGC
jgi:hypothetical protein